MVIQEIKGYVPSARTVGYLREAVNVLKENMGDLELAFGREEAFAEAENLANLDKKGLWSDEGFPATPAEPLYNPAVYITNTGEKYHQYHCQYLLESRIPIRLSEAVYLGYEPCSVCRPPIMFMEY